MTFCMKVDYKYFYKSYVLYCLDISSYKHGNSVTLKTPKFYYLVCSSQPLEPVMIQVMNPGQFLTSFCF